MCLLGPSTAVDLRPEEEEEELGPPPPTLSTPSPTRGSSLRLLAAPVASARSNSPPAPGRARRLRPCADRASPHAPGGGTLQTTPSGCAPCRSRPQPGPIRHRPHLAADAMATNAAARQTAAASAFFNSGIDARAAHLLPKDGHDAALHFSTVVAGLQAAAGIFPLYVGSSRCHGRVPAACRRGRGPHPHCPCSQQA